MTQDELTLFLDPNYDPARTYPNLDAWLLLYDRIFVGSPSSYQIEVTSGGPEAAHDRYRGLIKLAKAGWIIPVGRPRFFTEAWRTGRVRDLRESDVVRAKHFEWREAFDGPIAELAAPLDDERLDKAIADALELEHRDPDAFAWLQREVEVLRSGHMLPEKLGAPSELDRPLSDIAKGIIYEVAGDLWATAELSASGVRVASGYAPVYGLLDGRSAVGASALHPSWTRAGEAVEPGLDAHDAALAREITERLAAKYYISDILADYRGSNLQRQYRFFVHTALKKLRQSTSAVPAVERLWSTIQQQAEHIANVQQHWTSVLAAMGVAAAEVHPRVRQLIRATMKRRAFLPALVLTVCEFSGAPLFGKPVGRAESAVRREHDRWLTLIVNDAGHRM